MNVPFLDLKAQYRSIAEEITPAIQDVIDNTAFAGGPFVENLNRSLPPTAALRMQSVSVAEQKLSGFRCWRLMSDRATKSLPFPTPLSPPWKQ